MLSYLLNASLTKDSTDILTWLFKSMRKGVVVNPEVTSITFAVLGVVRRISGYKDVIP